MRSITSIVDTWFTVQSFAIYRFEREKSCIFPNMSQPFFVLSIFHLPSSYQSFELNLNTVKKKKKKEEFPFESFCSPRKFPFLPRIIDRPCSKYVCERERRFPEEIRVVNFFKIPRFHSNLESRCDETWRRKKRKGENEKRKRLVPLRF